MFGVVGAWLVAAVTSLLFATTSALGPSLELPASGREVQAGDIAVCLGLGAAAALVTRRAWPFDRAEVRLLLVGAAWSAALVLTVLVAVKTSLGPVVLPLSNSHGLHALDLGVALLAGGAAAMVGHAVLTPGPGRASAARAGRPDGGRGRRPTMPPVPAGDPLDRSRPGRR